MNAIFRSNVLLLCCRTALLFLATLLPLHAGNPNRTARLELSPSADQVEIEVDVVSDGGKASAANWPGTDPTKHMVVELSASTGWREASFTFHGKKSGRVILTLMGPYARISAHEKELYSTLVAYDDIKVEGATIKNGDFEGADTAGIPTDWRLFDVPNSLPPVTEKNRAGIVTRDSGKAARVWHNSRLSQTLQIEADKPVTVTLSYRLLD